VRVDGLDQAISDVLHYDSGSGWFDQAISDLLHYEL
jgi:hypothetical protein